MILITTGKFYTEGNPRIVANSKKSAINWLKNNGFKPTKDDINKNLFEKIEEGNSIWARLDHIESIK